MKIIIPCLWFDHTAQEAVDFYTSVFKDSSVGAKTYYGKEGFEIHHMPEDTVLTIEFTLLGQKFTALNGGPEFKFTEAVSFQVPCETQEEIDYYWEKLGEGSDQLGPCGWLKDKFGLSWQVYPAVMEKFLADPDKEKAGRAMAAMLKMNKLDISQLQAAFDGK